MNADTYIPLPRMLELHGIRKVTESDLLFGTAFGGVRIKTNPFIKPWEAIMIVAGRPHLIDLRKHPRTNDMAQMLRDMGLRL